MPKRLTGSQIDPCPPCILSLLVFFFFFSFSWWCWSLLITHSSAPVWRCRFRHLGYKWLIRGRANQHEACGCFRRVFPARLTSQVCLRGKSHPLWRRVGGSDWHLTGWATPISCQRAAHSHTACLCCAVHYKSFTRSFPRLLKQRAAGSGNKLSGLLFKCSNWVLCSFEMSYVSLHFRSKALFISTTFPIRCNICRSHSV